MKVKEFARCIERLRMDALFGGEKAAAVEDLKCPLAEQHYLQALSFLEAAERAADIAAIHEERVPAGYGVAPDFVGGEYVGSPEREPIEGC